MKSSLLTTELLQAIVCQAELNHEGNVADYIPELANVNQEMTGLAVRCISGNTFWYHNCPLEPVTLQSTAKLIPLIGLLEECGPEMILRSVKVEPSGDEFASISRLEKYGPKPSNPMLNAGAIALCSQIPGQGEEPFAWLDKWAKRLFNKTLKVNPLVLASEKRTGDRNRALAYLLKSRGILGTNVLESLDLYFTLCSYEATLPEMLYLPTLLANSGVDIESGERIISIETCNITLSIMATCGLYDESGTHLVRTGMPAKSGVSGYIIAVAPRKAGVAVLSPRVNHKGNSIRGEIMLEQLSKSMKWHFAMP